MIQFQPHYPKYLQISEHLKELIQKEYSRKANTTPFYSDDELVKMYSVSRMTIRQAIQVLVDQGYVERIQGRGTFVIGDKLQTDIAKLDTFFRGWYLENIQVKLLHVGAVPCPKEIAPLIGVDPGQEVYQVKRLRLSEDVPIVVDNRYLLKEYGEKITEGDYTTYSFSHIFLKKFGWSFNKGEIEIEATLADEQIAENLAIKVGDPVLYRSVQLSVDKYGCVLAGASYYRGDMYKYKSIMTAD